MCVVVFVIKLCCLTVVVVSFLLQTKKKIALACVACSRNDGVVTVVDLKFKVEQLDNKLTLLFSLCSHFTQYQHARDLDTQVAVIPDMPTPLQPCFPVNPLGGNDKDNYSASHGFIP
jgi:hypothetical protein